VINAIHIVDLVAHDLPDRQRDGTHCHRRAKRDIALGPMILQAPRLTPARRIVRLTKNRPVLSEGGCAVVFAEDEQGFKLIASP
jgi:hypothetical protein